MGGELSRRRGQALKAARALARSGEHRDHSSILPILRRNLDFRDAEGWFSDARFQAQLDGICAGRQPVAAPGPR
ncbi:hypothetical protein [Methylobacterium oryzihabitans]|uniref:Transposase n=1 Tax=Methylobacterium oryzihabitans TaxID=2499852 RepID=A0A437NZ70_9HYPH|nr:hypothetical protein [Methylobacterium oryzihabitans]RVU15316.1 hypothetical protein EOE48_19980 [Methylobacterium oryzihabitans]